MVTLPIVCVFDGKRLVMCMGVRRADEPPITPKRLLGPGRKVPIPVSKWGTTVFQLSSGNGRLWGGLAGAGFVRVCVCVYMLCVFVAGRGLRRWGRILYTKTIFGNVTKTSFGNVTKTIVVTLPNTRG